MGLNVKTRRNNPETIKRQPKRRYHDLGIDNDFSHMTPDEQATR